LLARVVGGFSLGRWLTDETLSDCARRRRPANRARPGAYQK